MRKFLFLPHCLRDARECSATFDQDGYHCTQCGRCTIARITEHAQQKGFSTYIVPGGSLAKKLLSKLSVSRDDVVVGVACDVELRELEEGFMSKIRSRKHKAVRLAQDGCINTAVNVDDLLLQLSMNYD